MCAGICVFVCMCVCVCVCVDVCVCVCVCYNSSWKVLHSFQLTRPLVPAALTAMQSRASSGTAFREGADVGVSFASAVSRYNQSYFCTVHSLVCKLIVGLEREQI